LPCRYQHSKKLISHDIHSNVYNYKFTYRWGMVALLLNSWIITLAPNSKGVRDRNISSLLLWLLVSVCYLFSHILTHCPMMEYQVHLVSKYTFRLLIELMLGWAKTINQEMKRETLR
jgi:hypothetical protein